MGVLIDSSVLIDLERYHYRGQPWPHTERLRNLACSIAAVTAAELLHGVERAQTAQRRAWRSRFVETLLAEIEVVPYTLEIAREHARLWADLAAQGVLIGDRDAQIAATALAQNLELWTLNERHFRRVERLVLVAR